MAFDKQMARIEAKLDLILDKLNVEYSEPEAKSTEPRQLSAAEQVAIDNAPKTPVGGNEPMPGPRVTAMNAPVTPTADQLQGKSKAKK